MEKKQFLWDFCSYSRVNSALFTTKRDEKRQKVFFYTNLASKMRLMENLGWNSASILEARILPAKPFARNFSKNERALVNSAFFLTALLCF